MADEENATPEQSVQGIRQALIRVEEQYPDSRAVLALHERLERGFRRHGHMLGFNDEQVELLAGGGTPKLPPPGDGG